jgi:hypothetical protein
MRTYIVNALSTTCVALGLAAAGQVDSAQAYPIDCAIFICMAGGFPASAECMAAKAEVIRRITPIPIEPPLKIWQCPMGIDANFAALIGLSPSQISPDGYTPEVTNLQNSIEVWDINYKVSRNSDGIQHTDSTKKGVLGKPDMLFIMASYVKGPEWLATATGGYRKPVYEYGGRDGNIKKLVGYENASQFGFRKIVLRWKDHEGNYMIETVDY